MPDRVTAQDVLNDLLSVLKESHGVVLSPEFVGALKDDFREAENDAIEVAAKIAEGYDTTVAKVIAQAIRALKEE